MGEIELWQVSLLVTPEQEQQYATLLNADEITRARRFHFAKHTRRFIVARAVLRILLSRYLQIPPAQIEFSYGEHGKPFLADSDWQFNLSHSDEIAVYAFTRTASIGVDVEKIEAPFKDDVAQRFFSASEYASLKELSGTTQECAFYRIWSRKEALVKALGSGLYISLSSFSVTLADQQTLTLESPTPWHIQSFNVDPDYEAAFATAQTITKVSQQKFFHPD